jgi:hypothetical protein
MSAETRPVCGNCQLFDTARIGGEQAGTTLGVEGQEIPVGFCRGLMGGLWGPTLTPEMPCKQSPGIFQPKEPLSESSVV